MNDSIITALDKLDSKLQTDKRETDDRLLQLEQRGSAWQGESTSKTESVGSQFVKAYEQNKDLFLKTKSLRLEISTKAAGDNITTASGRALVSGGVGFPTGGVLGFQNALPVRSVSATALEYSRYVGQQGVAAVQAAEGDLKSAVRPDHLLVTQVGVTIAAFAKMSKQALTDSSELARAVETTLSRSVATALDIALVKGAAGFVGGYAGLATASVASVAYTSLADAVSEAASQMQSDGFSPNVVAMSPADWLEITVAKSGGDGQYYSGSYLGTIAPTLRGLRVVLSPSIPAHKAILMDTSHSEILMIDGFSVEMGFTDDDFIRNLVVLRGELRFLPVFRALGSAKLVALAAI
jgi:HK97 family phage major capsid protein